MSTTGAGARHKAATFPVVRVGGAAILSIGAALLCGAGALAQHGALTQHGALPEGRGKADFQRICGACHPAGDAVKGMRRSREGWQQVVDDMVVRGAEGSEQELKLVVDYLAEHFGPSPGPRRP